MGVCWEASSKYVCVPIISIYGDTRCHRCATKYNGHGNVLGTTYALTTSTAIIAKMGGMGGIPNLHRSRVG